MKKLHIFIIIIICITLQVSCKSQKEQRSEGSNWTYVCNTITYWSDPKDGSQGRGLDRKNYSSAKTMNAAIAETLELTKKRFPKARDRGIYIKCEGRGETGFFGTDPCDYIGYARHCPETMRIPSVPGPKTKRSPDNINSITFGCRAWIGTQDGSRNSIYRNSSADTNEEAVKEIREAYKEEYPGARNFESNCWPCDLPKLDEEVKLPANKNMPPIRQIKSHKQS